MCRKILSILINIVIISTSLAQQSVSIKPLSKNRIDRILLKKCVEILNIHKPIRKRKAETDLANIKCENEALVKQTKATHVAH